MGITSWYASGVMGGWFCESCGEPNQPGWVACHNCEHPKSLEYMALREKIARLLYDEIGEDGCYVGDFTDDYACVDGYVDFGNLAHVVIAFIRSAQETT